MKKGFLTALILAQTITTTAYADSFNWTVNENNVVGYANKELYGMNFEWGDADGGGSHPGYLCDLYGNPMDFSKTTIAGYKFPNNRMAGGSANNFFWKKLLGDRFGFVNHKQDLVQEGKEGTYTYRKFGGYYSLPLNLENWLKTVYSADPDAKFDYVVNFLWDDIENVADVVEYLIGDGTVNHNGGVNWAEVRMRDGIKDPVNIVCWELGNEVDLFGVKIDEYIEGSKKAIAAIRSVDPDAKIAAHVATNDTSAVGQSWIRMVLKEIGNEIDMVAMHKYYDMKNICRVAEPQIVNVMKDLEMYGLDDRIEIVFTEHAMSPGSTSYPLRNITWPTTRAQKAVLSEVDFFSRVWNYPNVIGANYHAFSAGPWSVLYYDYDGVMKPTAILDLLQIYIEKGVGEVVENTLDGFVANAPADVVGNIIKTEDGLNVFIGNMLGEPAKINFNFEGKYTLTGKTKMWADSLEAKNWYGENGIHQEYIEIKDGELLTEYEIPKYSFEVLELKKID